MSVSSRICRAIAFMLIIAGWQPRAGSLALAGEPATQFTGTWKLVVLAFGEDEFAIIDMTETNGKAAATVAVTQRSILGNASVESIANRADSLEIELRGPAGTNKFQGKLAHEGPQDGRILGTFTYRGDVFPARVERTENHRIAGLGQGEIAQEYGKSRSESDPKTKVRNLQNATKKYQGNPTSYLLYGELLAAAEAGGLKLEEVDAAVKAALEDARPYGPAWVSEVRRRAIKALGAARPYAKLTLELAQEADKETSEEDNLAQKAAVVASMAHAARLAGEADVARDAEARSARLESRLDEEYHKQVPPFKAETFSGRKNSKSDRVVLMELFTGAQCPPCVAADVAFDALLATYKPTEFIGLQYHLHIPGPDPLTNNDTLGRQNYYGDEVGGTPATFFNGRSQAGGGGFMQHSEQKYKQFRQVIDSQLEGAKGATIHLSATRSGDEIKIAAQASLTAKPVAAKGAAGDPDSTKSGESRPRARLRLVLSEASIRYVGNNKLRFHHHVVRGFPGGLEGKDLSSGSGEVAVTVKLADLRHDIETYVSDFNKKHAFPGVLPAIDLKDLSVVAFVQDDADKSILNAVPVPVK